MTITDMTMPAPDVVEIDDAIALDAINDPLRARIWSQLREPRSVRELAAGVGVAAPRLYYHLEILERHGWIAVDDERKTATRPSVSTRPRSAATA